MSARYDDDDLSIKKKESQGSSTMFVVFVAGGIGLVFFTIVFGIAMIGVVGFFVNSPAAKLTGSWKTRFVIDGIATDHIYTFRKDGTFREEAFNLQGVRTHVNDGVWHVHGDEVVIDWNDGVFEEATLRWIDDNTIDYRIIDHKDVVQIGMNVTLRRQ